MELIQVRAVGHQPARIDRRAIVEDRRQPLCERLAHDLFLAALNERRTNHRDRVHLFLHSQSERREDFAFRGQRQRNEFDLSSCAAICICLK